MIHANVFVGFFGFVQAGDVLIGLRSDKFAIHYPKKVIGGLLKSVTVDNMNEGLLMTIGFTTRNPNRIRREKHRLLREHLATPSLLSGRRKCKRKLFHSIVAISAVRAGVSKMLFFVLFSFRLLGGHTEPHTSHEHEAHTKHTRSTHGAHTEHTHSTL